MHPTVSIENFVLNLLASWPYLLLFVPLLALWADVNDSETPLGQKLIPRRGLYAFLVAAHLAGAVVNVWVYQRFFHVRMHGILSGTTPNGTALVVRWLEVTAPIAAVLVADWLLALYHSYRHTGVAEKLDQAVTEKARASSERLFRETQVIGTAGASVVDAAGKFGVSRALAGQVGEAVVAQWLEKWVAGNPGAWLFHDLTWPGESNANIDHVLVVNQAVWVIDSKNWKPGVYTRDIEGLTMRDGQPFPPADKTSAAESVHRLREYLDDTDGYTVGGMIVVHPSGRGELDVSGLNGLSGVPYVRLRDLTLRSAYPFDFPLETLRALQKLVITPAARVAAVGVR